MINKDEILEEKRNKIFTNPIVSTPDGKTARPLKIISPEKLDIGDNNLVDTYELSGLPKPPSFGKFITGDVLEGKSPIQHNGVSDDPMTQIRIQYQVNEQFLGYKDPRELPNDQIGNPAGHIYQSRNNINGNIEIYPAYINETINTVTKTPIGPLRSSEKSIRKRQVGQMYDLNYQSLDTFIGYDSKGKARFTDGNSYVERCIFTGYDKSFMQPVSTYYSVSQSFDIYGNQIVDLVTENVLDELLILSKSGNYYTRSLPIKTMFLGYNDDDVIPSKNCLSWVDDNIDDSKYSRRWYYDDEISLNSLKYNRIVNIEDTPLSDYILDKSKKNLTEFRQNESLYWNKSILESIPTQENSLQIRSQNLLNLIAANCRKKTELGDTSSQYFEGSYRKLLYSLDKSDVIEYVIESGEVSLLNLSVNLNTVNNPIKNEINISYPRLKRRSEQYGPNPMQHLFFMDFYDWRKYTTTYIPKTPSGQVLIESNGNYVELPNDIYPRWDRFTYNLGRKNEGLYRHPSETQNAVDLSKRYTKLSENLIQDNTYILDIYFGLMEMHLKGYPWKIIMKIIDLIPQFYGDFMESSSVNWKNKTDSEKSAYRLQELNDSLPRIWSIIDNILNT